MRYICTNCGKYSFSAAGSESGISDKCLESGCDGKVVPSPEYNGFKIKTGIHIMT